VDRQLRQHLAAVGDAVRQDMVEGGDAVGRHHEELLVAELVGVADLPLGEQLQRKVGADEGWARNHFAVTPRPRRSKARSVCCRPAHGSKTCSSLPPMRLITSSLFSSRERNPGPVRSIACMAAFCTIEYASSRAMPLSTSASSTRCENTTPPANCRLASMRSERTSSPRNTLLISIAM